VLQNADPSTLTVHQVAAHLGTRSGNITRELNLAAAGEPGRLRGTKVTGPSVRGRGGQWRITRDDYLDWLGMPEPDRSFLRFDGLPELYPIWAAALELNRRAEDVRAVLPYLPHLIVLRHRYLTHNQLERLRVLSVEDCRDKPR
jgi:hypothetical protein